MIVLALGLLFVVLFLGFLLLVDFVLSGLVMLWIDSSTGTGTGTFYLSGRVRSRYIVMYTRLYSIYIPLKNNRFVFVCHDLLRYIGL